MTQHDALVSLSHCLDIFRAHVNVALENIETDTDDEILFRMSCTADSLIQDFYEFLEENQISLSTNTVAKQ